MSEMKKRWIALYVENDVGVLAKTDRMGAGADRSHCNAFHKTVPASGGPY